MLGERCKLLKLNGLSTYVETEETLAHALKLDSVNGSTIDICIESSHCSGFYKGFTNEITPFIDKDPIVLLGMEINTLWLKESIEFVWRYDSALKQ